MHFLSEAPGEFDKPVQHRPNGLQFNGVDTGFRRYDWESVRSAGLRADADRVVGLPGPSGRQNQRSLNALSRTAITGFRR